MDLVILLAKTKCGYDAVFTVVDYFSKLVTFVSYKTSSTVMDIVQVLFDYIVCKFRMPKNTISYHNLRFVSEFQTIFMAKLGTKVGLSSSYHLQTYGQSERFHRSVEQIFWCTKAPSQDDWQDVLV